MNVIVITGASSGIGKEFAYQMDRYFTNIDEFWLIARSKDKLENLKNELGSKGYLFSYRTFDVSQKEKWNMAKFRRKKSLKNG